MMHVQHIQVIFLIKYMQNVFHFVIIVLAVNEDGVISEANALLAVSSSGVFLNKLIEIIEILDF